MRYVLLLVLLTASAGLAQTTRPTSSSTTQPAADRTTPLGTFLAFDKTVADLSVDQAMAFYHCTTDPQRRYARSECEYYIAVNRLVRATEKQFDKAIAKTVREQCGDSDDYTNVVVREEGDAAAMVRPGQPPLALIRINELWHFSMPDQFEINTEVRMMGMRPTYERTTDRINALRERLESGDIRTAATLLRQASDVREVAP